MKIKLLLAIGLISIGQLSAQSIKKYSIEELNEDLDYLYSSLQESHYNLFANTSEIEYQKAYEDLRKTINDSLNIYSAYRLLQPFVGLAQNGHCQILPYSLYGMYYENKGTVFPLNVCFMDEKVCVTNNFSTDSLITPGDEIVSINGKPIEQIMDKMHNFYSGESAYFINTLIEMLTFPRLYWVAFGRFDDFNLKLKNRKKKTISVTVKAITTEEFETKNAAVKPLMNSSREFKFIDNIAYLHPGGFSKQNAQNEFESSDNTIFCQFIDSAFTEIYKSNVKNLIIDLRNNPGGHNSFSDYMLSFIADKQYRFSDKFIVRTSELTKTFWKEINDSSLLGLKNSILSNENGTSFENKIPYNRPRLDSLNFKGKVYVLINRFDFSQAVNTAAVVQDYKFGELIGEETADHSSLLASAQYFNLPNSGFTVQYPKAFIVRPNGNEKAEGVIPDYKISDDIFTDKDEILEFAIELIKNENRKNHQQQETPP